MTWYRVEGQHPVYAHDRTLLARLGFADPDRKLPEHDLALHYLAEPEQARAVAELVAEPHRLTFSDRLHEVKRHGPYLLKCPCPSSLTIDGAAYSHCSSDTVSYRTTRTGSPATVTTTTMELPLQKGERQYQTTIGFVNLVIRYIDQEIETGQYLRHEYVNGYGPNAKKLPASWQPFKELHRTSAAVFIEVKIAPVSLGEILRQVKLYDSYLDQADHYTGRYDWVVATRFPLSTADVEALINEEITHVRLGTKFEAYVAQQQAQVSARPSDSPEI
jgi:hypothetical protein